MTPDRCCANCLFWRRETAPEMDRAAHAAFDEDMGACEFVNPQIFIINGYPVTLQPTTHMTRCCGDHLPQWGDDENPDPNGGDPHPVPTPDDGKSRVRNLFPIQPVPIAA